MRCRSGLSKPWPVRCGAAPKRRPAPSDLPPRVVSSSCLFFDLPPPFFDLPLPFLDLPPPFLDLPLPFLRPPTAFSSTFHRLSLTFHRLSMPLFTVRGRRRQCRCRAPATRVRPGCEAFSSHFLHVLPPPFWFLRSFVLPCSRHPSCRAPATFLVPLRSFVLPQPPSGVLPLPPDVLPLPLFTCFHCFLLLLFAETVPCRAVSSLRCLAGVGRTPSTDGTVGLVLLRPTHQVNAHSRALAPVILIGLQLH